MTIACGGGLTETNAHALVAATGCREVHGSLRLTHASGMRHRPAQPLPMGAEKLNHPESEFEVKVVDDKRVRAVLEALRSA